MAARVSRTRTQVGINLTPVGNGLLFFSQVIEAKAPLRDILLPNRRQTKCIFRCRGKRKGMMVLGFQLLKNLAFV